VVYLDKLSPRQSIGLMMSRVGITTPMYCTGLGKALAAFHSDDEIRPIHFSRAGVPRPRTDKITA
jgi:DNA-binding IclR family transcriptional regulator